MSLNVSLGTFSNPMFKFGPLNLTPPHVQGTAFINTTMFDSVIEEINQIADMLNPCAFAQEVMNRAMALIQAQYNALVQRIENLAIVKLLLSIPSDIQSVITWITNLITFLIKPYYQAYLDGIATMALLVEKVGEITSAISNLTSKLTHCNLTIPSFVPYAGVAFTP